MSQKILYFPLRWLCGLSQHNNLGADGEEGLVAVVGQVTFQIWTEPLSSREWAKVQHCARSGKEGYLTRL